LKEVAEDGGKGRKGNEKNSASPSIELLVVDVIMEEGEDSVALVRGWISLEVRVSITRLEPAVKLEAPVQRAERESCGAIDSVEEDVAATMPL
jgi:hypothetical protein